MFSCSSVQQDASLAGIVTQPDAPAVHEGCAKPQESNLPSWEGAATTSITTSVYSQLWPWGEVKNHKDFLFLQAGGKKTENICPEPLLLPEGVKSSEDWAEEAAR